MSFHHGVKKLTKHPHLQPYYQTTKSFDYLTSLLEEAPNTKLQTKLAHGDFSKEGAAAANAQLLLRQKTKKYGGDPDEPGVDPRHYFPTFKLRKPLPKPIRVFKPTKRNTLHAKNNPKYHFYTSDDPVNKPNARDKILQHINPEGYRAFTRKQMKNVPLVEKPLYQPAPYKAQKYTQPAPRQPAPVQEEPVRAKSNIGAITTLNQGFRLPTEKRLTRLIPLKSDDKVIVPFRTFNPWGNKYRRFYNR